jgi:lipopolysaccharide/colanic/teichoic acid biosynthesis glycosyltransferase
VHGAKRLLDLVVGSALLVVLSPLMIVLGALVRITSPGPAVFAQERWGSRRVRRPDGAVAWEARTFQCLKFRTMAHCADPGVHEDHVRAFVAGRLGGGADRAAFKLSRDPRVTAVGRFLRATSLDELPQLLNVLRGEMSLVGPRPVPLYEVESYPGEWCLGRLGALPGVTGIWQVRGRSRVSFEEMVLMDLDYVRRPSLVRDIGLLCLTVPCVVARRGAR